MAINNTATGRITSIVLSLFKKISSKTGCIIHAFSAVVAETTAIQINAKISLLKCFFT